MTPVGEALRSMVMTMAENMTDTWTTLELYSMYLAASGTVSRRQFVSSITTYFGNKLLLLHIDGCESVVGFKASLGQFIKIAKKNNSNSDDDELEKLMRMIYSEVKVTSATLFKLVSSLVSGGATT